MDRPHFDKDSQTYHTINVSEFNERYLPNQLGNLRFYLYQPSPCWRSFCLRCMYVYLSCHLKEGY